MDLDKLYYTKHWLEYSSFSFTVEKYVILTNSLIVLQNENHFKKMFFWGIIHALDINYYISVGYKTDAILDRTYFYSDDCQNWKLLPKPQNNHIALSELCKTPFQGDPGLVLEIVDDTPALEIMPDYDLYNGTNVPEVDKVQAPEQIGNRISFDDKLSNEEQNEDKGLDKRSNEELSDDKGVEEENLLYRSSKSVLYSKSTITSGSLKEEDRLAAAVKIITEETAVVPRGALFKQSDGTHVHSRAFQGLTIEDADELRSFQHYRLPQHDWNTNLMARIDYNYAIDFLDTIDKDIPSDCWTGQLIEGDRLIFLRNLLWPEFLFFHHIGTPDHGCVYIGNGQRNLDLPFMIQIGEKTELESKESETDVKSSSRIRLATLTLPSNGDISSQNLKENSLASQVERVSSVSRYLDTVSLQSQERVNESFSVSQKVSRVSSGSQKLNGVSSGSQKLKGISSGSQKLNGVSSGSQKLNGVSSGSQKLDGVSSGSQKLNGVSSGSQKLDGVSSGSQKLNGVSSGSQNLNAVGSTN